MPRRKTKKKVPEHVRKFVDGKIARNLEKKQHFVQGTGSVSQTTTYTCLTGVNETSTTSSDDHWRQRDGYQVNPRILRTNTVIGGNASATSNMFRIWIVRCKFPTKETGGTAGTDAPDLDELLDEPTDSFYRMQCTYDPRYSKKYEVLYDSNARQVEAGSKYEKMVFRKNFVKGKHLPSQMKFEANASDLARDHVWLITHGLDNTNQASFRIHSSFEFTDA